MATTTEMRRRIRSARRLAPGTHVARAAVAAVAASLLAGVAAGCVPLAAQDPFFDPSNGEMARSRKMVKQMVSHHLALQAAQRACPPATAPTDASIEREPADDGPDLGRAPAREALFGVCTDTLARTEPVAAHGGTANAYRRWAEDSVRELPAPDETVATAGGD